MNNCQQLWWEQAKSDHELFLMLLHQGVAQCHVLHQLQMATEKIAKAYFWRSGKAPRRSHIGFMQFLKSLIDSRERERIARIMGFRSSNDLRGWISLISPIVYELERLAPALATDGPNAEYPWPHFKPRFSPVNFSFPSWNLVTSSSGRQLMSFIKDAVNRFPEYANL